MDDSNTANRDNILRALDAKAHLKSFVFSQSLEVFNQFKEILSEISNDWSDILEEQSKDRIGRLEYRDRGRNEAELKFGDDVLIFSLHTNIFSFDRDHPIWKNEYVKADPSNSYCGVISIYNFLSDSLKYNRSEDLGYLVARVYINKDCCFFAEGKRQLKQLTKDFGAYAITRNEIMTIIEQAIIYTLNFDLLVPPYDIVKVASVEQIYAKMENEKMKTGKRMGFKYNSDDVLNENE